MLHSETTPFWKGLNADLGDTHKNSVIDVIKWVCMCFAFAFLQHVCRSSLVMSLSDALIGGLFLIHSSVWNISNSWQNQQVLLRPAAHLHRNTEFIKFM